MHGQIHKIQIGNKVFVGNNIVSLHSWHDIEIARLDPDQITYIEIAMAGATCIFKKVSTFPNLPKKLGIELKIWHSGAVIEQIEPARTMHTDVHEVI